LNCSSAIRIDLSNCTRKIQRVIDGTVTKIADPVVVLKRRQPHYRACTGVRTYLFDMIFSQIATSKMLGTIFRQSKSSENITLFSTITKKYCANSTSKYFSTKCCYLYSLCTDSHSNCFDLVLLCDHASATRSFHVKGENHAVK